MTKTNNDTQRLPLDRISNWLTLGIVVIAFILSFGALRDLAAEMGIVYPSLYPLMIDAGLVIYNLMVLQSSLNGERNRYAWFLIVMATAVSVFLNVAHSLDELPTGLAVILKPAMAAIPPLVIFGAFHLVVLHIERNARRTRVLQPLAALETAVAERQTELDGLEKTVRNRTAEMQRLAETVQTRTVELNQLAEQVRLRTAERDNLNGQLQRLASNLDAAAEQSNTVSEHPNATTEQSKVQPGQPRTALRTVQVFNPNAVPVQPNGQLNTEPNVQAEHPNGKVLDKETALDALLAYVVEQPDASLVEIGEVIGRSKSTVSNYVAELIAAERLSKNGQGWTVLDVNGIDAERLATAVAEPNPNVQPEHLNTEYEVSER